MTEKILENDIGDLFGEDGTQWTDLVAEQKLLGMLLAKPSLVDKAVQLVAAGDFFDRYHATMFTMFEAAASDGFEVNGAAIISRIGGPTIPMLSGRTLGEYVGYLAGLGFDAINANEDAQDVADHIQRVAELRAYGDEPVHMPAAFKSTMGLVMWADQNDPRSKEYEYIIEDLIPRGQGVVITGASGTGKSFFTFKLGMSLARKVPFFGREILKKMAVVWLAFEAGDGSPARMRAYRKYHNLQVDDTPFAMLTRPIHLWEKAKPNAPNAPERERAVDKIIAEIRGLMQYKMPGYELGAVVIDTYNAATPGASEIDSEVVSVIREDFHRIITELGATLIVVGHTNDKGENRGNKQLTNNFDTVIKIERKTVTIGRGEQIAVRDKRHYEIRTAKLIKQREGIDSASHDFVLHIVPDGTKNAFGKDRTSCVAVEPDRTVEQERRERAPSGMTEIKRPKELALFKTLVSAIKRDGRSMPADIRAPKGAIGVKWGEWLAEAQRKLIEDVGGDIEAAMTEKGKGSAHQRAKDAIAAAKDRWDGHLIGHDAGWYWRTKTLVHTVDERPQRRDVSADVPDFDFDPSDFPPN